MSLRWKGLAAILSIILVTTSVGGWATLRIMEDLVLDQTVKELTATAEIQEKRVNEAIDRYFEWVGLASSRTTLRNNLRLLNAGPDSEATDQLEAILRDIRASIPSIVRLAAISQAGQVVAATDPAISGEQKSDSEVFQLGLQAVALVDVVKDKDNRVQIVLTGPIVLDGETIGVLEVITTADALIAITEDYTGLGETGEFLIVRRNVRGDAVFLTPIRFDSGAALRRAIPAEKENVPVIPAVNGREEVFREVGIEDYRGEPVIAVTRFIETLGWGLVAKIDRSEALIPIVTLRQTIIVLVIVSMMLVSLVIYIMATIITKPIRLLTANTARLAKGDFSQRVRITTRDEIGTLGRSIDRMAIQLKGLYEGLEARVKNRTDELEKALAQVESQAAGVEKQRTAILNVLEDLNEEKAKSDEARAKTDAILQNIGDGLLVTDTALNVVVSNKAAGQMLGLKPEAIQGKPVAAVVRKKLSDGKPVPDKEFILRRAMQSGKAIKQRISDDYYFTKADGSMFPVAMTAAPITVGGEIVGGVVVFRDVSLEREIDKAKTEFVSLASHQLRTPLSTINWYAEMLIAGDAGKLTKEQQQYIDEIYKGNQRMVQLVNSLLDVSRIELGTFSVEPEPTNIITLAQDTIREQEPDIFKKKQKLEEQYDESLPELMLDQKLVKIVIQNLVSNAIKYTPAEGTIQLSIAKEGENIQLTVKDTGMGIPKEQQDKIFTKLFRADNVKTSDTTGTGLGLYLAKSIVEHSGGKIWFESEENKGTTFYVVLPMSGMKAKQGSRRLGE